MNDRVMCAESYPVHWDVEWIVDDGWADALRDVGEWEDGWWGISEDWICKAMWVEWWQLETGGKGREKVCILKKLCHNEGWSTNDTTKVKAINVYQWHYKSKSFLSTWKISILFISILISDGMTLQEWIAVSFAPAFMHQGDHDTCSFFMVHVILHLLW